MWSWVEFAVVVLGTMQQVKVSDKVMSYIKLFHSGRGYYCGNMSISCKYLRSVGTIRISRKYQRSVDIICIS